jgi:hypothetical protein
MEKSVADNLQSVLEQQAADLPEQSRALMSQWKEGRREEAVDSLCELSASVHRLRDIVMEILVTIMRRENHLDEYSVRAITTRRRRDLHPR